jgi:hypothetical protein
MNFRHQFAQELVLPFVRFTQLSSEKLRMNILPKRWCLCLAIVPTVLEQANARMFDGALHSGSFAPTQIPVPPPPHLITDPTTLALPLLLIAYYFVVWLAVGRDPKIGSVSVQYQPPKGMSPAEARFALIGGTDRKTIAAVLAHMATEKVVHIVPVGDEYDITRLVEAAPKMIPAGEERAFEVLFPRDAANPQGPTRRVNPKDATLMIQFSSQIYESLRVRVGGKYFRRNLGWSVLGFLFSMIYALVLVARYPSHDAIFLVFWYFMFSLGLGAIVATNIVPLFKDWVRGELNMTNATRSFLGLPVFLAPALFVDYLIAGKSSWAFGEMMVVVIVLNIVCGVLLKSATAEGTEAKRRLEGFKQYLLSVERDRLDKLNHPDQSPVLMEEFFAYAIALDLKEGWGDQLENSLFGVASWR